MGQGVRTPSENQKSIGFLSNTGPVSLKNQASIQCWATKMPYPTPCPPLDPCMDKRLPMCSHNIPSLIGRSGLVVLNILFSCSTHHRIKFILLINVKMPAIAF